MKFTAGKFLRLERDIFQPTTQPTECGVLLDCERLMRPLAVPAVLEVVVKPMRGPLSRQRPRVRVPSSRHTFKDSQGSDKKWLWSNLVQQLPAVICFRLQTKINWTIDGQSQVGSSQSRGRKPLPP